MNLPKACFLGPWENAVIPLAHESSGEASSLVLLSCWKKPGLQRGVSASSLGLAGDSQEVPKSSFTPDVLLDLDCPRAPYR